MDKHKKQADSKIERCVICGKPTEYRRDTPISKRECYVDGAGQLCRECFRKFYLPKNSD